MPPERVPLARRKTGVSRSVIDHDIWSVNRVPRGKVTVGTVNDESPHGALVFYLLTEVLQTRYKRGSELVATGTTKQFQVENRGPG